MDKIGRHCEVHGWHGPLYRCDQYPPETLEEIDRLGGEYMRNLNDPAWIQRQVEENGIPLMAITLFKGMAGIG